MFDKILVPLDGSTLAERALPYAMRIAQATSASITLLHVTSGADTPDHSQAELNAAIQVEHLAEHLRDQQLKAAARIMPGDAVEAIVAATELSHTTLIVMSTHGRTGLGRWLYGSVAEEVLRHAEAPVLLVSAACDHPWPTDRPLKILVPLDGSETSEAALTPAWELGKVLDGELVLVRSVEPAAAPDFRFDPEQFHIERATPDSRLDRAQEYLQEKASQSRAAVGSVQVLVEVGDPSSRIAATARQEAADVIVMATHGRTGLPGLTKGSVALGTMHRAHVPILLVRPAVLRWQETMALSGTATSDTVTSRPR